MLKSQPKTYKAALENLLGVEFDGRAKMRMRSLEEEGYSEGVICHAISLEQEILRKHRGDPEFWTLIKNAVKKRSWTKVEQRPKKPKETEAGCVYFLQGDNGGPIKIGYSKDVSKRIKELQTGFPARLTVLALMPGSRTTEAELHRKFKVHRLQGEC